MAENSKIEWCDHTFNPWTGCAKVSPGCANCYAEGWAKRSGHVQWGPGKPRRRTSVAEWRKPVKWDREAAGAAYEHASEAPLRDEEDFPPPHRPRVFCASLADWLDDEVPIEWLADLLALIYATPNLDWLLLTKRPENWERRMRQRMEAALDPASCADWINGTPPSNVWIGTTVEDQQRADERIPVLLSIPARVRFLSCEPLLGQVNLTQYQCGQRRHEGGTFTLFGDALSGFRATSGYSGVAGPRVHWVIAGGESGPGARPMHPDWARSLRDQCASAGVPFLLKQWGEWAPFAPPAPERYYTPQCEMRKDGKMVTVRTTFGHDFYKLGKARAGRLLDGREWNEFPEVKAS